MLTGQVCELMGILNCTPDSFFDGGRHNQVEAAISHAIRLLDEGASMIDIGGESSRPGAESVSAHEELRRVLPVVEALCDLRRERSFAISIDTVKTEVARQAVRAGAEIINDISMAQSDPAMIPFMVESGASVVLNHMRGEPRTMQLNPHYDNVVAEVQAELLVVAQRLESMGMASERICLDPGIGFGKRLEDNYLLISQASAFHTLGYPLLYGMSRKSYIGRTPGLENSDRLMPSIASALMVAQAGTCVLRVHDVAATREALLMWNAIGA